MACRYLGKNMTESIAILGATGSIGRQALEVARHLGLSVAGLSANQNVDLLEEQVLEFRPRFAALMDRGAAKVLAERLSGSATKVLAGIEGLDEIATMEGADVLLAATVGTDALEAVHKAASRGKKIALANKEAMVCAGALITEAAGNSGAEILPVDSEHSAIFQCIASSAAKPVKILLTASGGPFRLAGEREMNEAGPGQALSHPTWQMGAKITVDSASMMNKGFEWIEAKWLFSMPADAIQIVIHPQSVVHSAVEFADGAVIAQMGTADMRIPIQYAFTHPARSAGLAAGLDFSREMNLSFYPPDFEKFPCLGLAREAIHAKGSLATVMAAADDVAVEAFIGEKIAFGGIAQIIEREMASHTPFEPAAISEVDELAKETKARVRRRLGMEKS